jgi:sporulation protein YlmC with PRC-barrel domain
MKKLRGSGGYVMASVNDDQQRKGNLGGPDLFLAPIGRLESDKISKYFCNTCEKDYEGSPKIEFENPNEEVAENLILAEKGQYVCATCGSTIAEYRDFRKPDELGDVGFAKPIEQGIDSPTMTFSEPTPDTSFMEPPPAIQEETPSMPQFDIPQPSMDTPSASIEQQSTSSVNSIVGMSVFDDNGLKIGTAKQVGVDSSQNVVLVITRNDGTDLIIPWNKIKKVGEIILLGNQTGTEPQVQSTSIQSGDTCSSCGFANKMGSKFCEQCGSKI